MKQKNKESSERLSTQISKEEEIKRKREFYALTLIIVPTIIVAILAQYIENFFVRIISVAILIFLQAVVVRGLIENEDN